MQSGSPFYQKHVEVAHRRLNERNGVVEKRFGKKRQGFIRAFAVCGKRQADERIMHTACIVLLQQRDRLRRARSGRTA